MLAAESAAPTPRAAHHYGGPSEWRWIGARDKADNVVALARDGAHRSVVEVGAGDGALLARLSERGFAEELAALEISESGLVQTRAREIPELSECQLFDGERIPFDDDRFDLAVLSHVLEHAEQPRRLLMEAARVARRVFVEVPLEDHWRLPDQFEPNALGHINYFSQKSLRRFVQTCDLAVVGERVVNPSREVYAARFGGGLGGAWRWALKQGTLRVVPALAQRLWTYHGALLCQKASGARG
jgi:SAM-dependent methyltransferase